MILNRATRVSRRLFPKKATTRIGKKLNRFLTVETKIQNKKISKVAIIGAGPVGLTLSHLLHQQGVSFDLIEQRESLIEDNPDFEDYFGTQSKEAFRPPAAHYINCRSMEILNSIPGFEQEVEPVLEPMEDYKFYRYCRRLDDFEFWVDVQFDGDTKTALGYYTTSFPQHLSQNRLVGVLEKCLRKKIDLENFGVDPQSVTLGHIDGVNGADLNLDHLDESSFRLLYGTEIKNYKIEQKGENQQTKVILEAEGRHREEIEDSSYDIIVATDGYHSSIREKTQIRMHGNKDMQTFLNVCFKSKRLARSLDRRRLKAMLHFIYNPEIVGCLVNHSYKEGIFVLQVPINPEVEDLGVLLDNSDKSIVTKIFGPRLLREVESDIQILSKGLWELSSEVADRFHENRVLLAGDSAHSIPPAGGLGMNTGIQDAQNLAFKIFELNHLKNDSGDFSIDRMARQYSVERKEAALKNKTASDLLYENSLKVAEGLMLHKSALNVISGAVRVIPGSKTFKSSLFETIKKQGTQFLESDVLMRRMATKLYNAKSFNKREQWGGRWIPMLLLDEECNIQYSNIDSIELNNPSDFVVIEELKQYRGLLAMISYLRAFPANQGAGREVCLRTLHETLFSDPEEGTDDAIFKKIIIKTEAEIKAEQQDIERFKFGNQARSTKFDDKGDDFLGDKVDFDYKEQHLEYKGKRRFYDDVIISNFSRTSLRKILGDEVVDKSLYFFVDDSESDAKKLLEMTDYDYRGVENFLKMLISEKQIIEKEEGGYDGMWVVRNPEDIYKDYEEGLKRRIDMFGLVLRSDGHIRVFFKSNIVGDIVLVEGEKNKGD